MTTHSVLYFRIVPPHEPHRHTALTGQIVHSTSSNRSAVNYEPASLMKFTVSRRLSANHPTQCLGTPWFTIHNLTREESPLFWSLKREKVYFYLVANRARSSLTRTTDTTFVHSDHCIRLEAFRTHSIVINSVQICLFSKCFRTNKKVLK